jgi:hypothetical protein
MIRDKSYVIVYIMVDDNDEPLRDPAEVAREIVDHCIEGVYATRPAFSDGIGGYYVYGEQAVRL